MKLDDFQRIFRSSFDDPEEWQRWFFDNVATDADEVYVSVGRDGKAASALLMQPYGFLYRGAVLPSAYISCVATLPEARSQGLASRTMREALSDARLRGYALCTLIPAEEHLTYFYKRLGFTTAFYADRRRYTGLHEFRDGAGTPVEASFDTLHRLEMRWGCGVLHSQNDYAEIVADMRIDGENHIIAVADADGGEAMLFATVGPDEAKVKCLLADSEALAQGALAELRRRIAEKPVTVYCAPLSGEKAFLTPAGMVRVTDPMPLLSALAASDPKMSLSIRIADKLLTENSGTYILHDGTCRHDDTVAHPDLDIESSTLADILFSNHRTGALFGIPSRRPYMALMLD